GFGTASGHRFVAGVWARSPFGPFADIMWEQPDGRRVLIAPNDQIRDFVASTYRFDDTIVTPVYFSHVGATWTVRAEPVSLSLTPGRPDLVGWLLAAVPRPIRRSRLFAQAADWPAKRVLPGVRTAGVAPGGNRQWYCAQDHRPLVRGAAWLHADPLGAAQPIDPPVTFGFSSTPSRPAWVRVVTYLEDFSG
ncbi:MAG: hypothetical protein ABIM89_13800, partial [Mycobacteriales bacterium]